MQLNSTCKYAYHKTEIDDDFREVDDDFWPSVNAVLVLARFEFIWPSVTEVCQS